MYNKTSNPILGKNTKSGLLTIHDLINDLFTTGVSPVQSRADAPKVNVYNEPDQFRIEVIAPGFEKDQLKISIQEDQLIISGTYAKDSKSSETCCTRKEHVFSSFNRRFNLPEAANTDSITASYTNGVLQVIIPKREETKPSQPKEVVVS